MFDFDTVIELMKKYGYSSTSVHPYIYQNGDNLGICYTYIDDDYGLLERIKIFDDLESFEFFLKQLEFVKNHGKENNIRMVLDNYESMNPKVVFLRDEKIMLEGEMFNIPDFDRMLKQRDQLDDVMKVIYKAGDLLLVYDEIKGRQLQYLRNIITLKNTLRRKYYELQKEIDTYNKYKVERALNFLPDINDIGINDRMEIAIKDRYNIYIAQPPTYEEAVDFLREVWDLNKNLELNRKYYEAQKDENDTRNEIKVVDAKLELMKELNEDYRPLFGIDLVSRFRKINRKYNLVNNKMSDDMVKECIENIERKYSVFDYLDILSTSDYLREAMQNTNYGDLAIKYSNSSSRDLVITNRLPLNEAAASLSIQYRDKLTIQEQAIMVLYNNHKYRKLCNAILEIESFDTLPIKKVISKISGTKGFSKIKSECYDIVKKRINDPINAAIKASLFSEYDFSSFESFISCLIRKLVKLRQVNNKMVVNGNISMYLQIKNVEDVSNKKFVMVTNDLNGLLSETKENNNMIAIVFLKEGTPVIYSPYYFDVGDIYSKDASLQMYIREMINFELLIETTDIAINVDPVKTNVVRYYTQPEVYDNISVVEDIMMNYKTTFCKYSFRNNLPVIQQAVPVNEMVQTTVVNQTVNSVETPNVGSGIQEGPAVIETPSNVEGIESNEANVNLDNQPVVPVVEGVSTVESQPVSNVTSESSNVPVYTQFDESVNRKENVQVTSQVNTDLAVEKDKMEDVDKKEAVVGNPVKEENKNLVQQGVAQPTQSVKTDINKAMDTKESSIDVKKEKVEPKVLNVENKASDALKKPQTNVVPEKVVKQAVSKPVNNGSSVPVQPMAKKVLVSGVAQKPSVPSTNSGKEQGYTPIANVTKPVASTSVKPIQTSTLPKSGTLAKPVVKEVQKVVPPVSNTINKATVANKTPVSSTVIAPKSISQKTDVTANNKIVPKKVVVNSVASQKPVKTSVVVNNVGAPTHTGQPVQTKPSVEVIKNTVSNPSLSKDSGIVDKE